MLAVLSGGGTAGHINPAIALADELSARGHEVRFAGTPNGVEARLITDAGIPFTPFEAAGFNRNHPLSIVKGVRLIAKSTKAAKKWFEEIRPDVDFLHEQRLIDDGILDSFDIITIVSEFNETFGIDISVEDLEPANFNTAEAMQALITKLQDEF